MRGWGWIVVVGLLGCVDPFPEIGGSQQVDADARPADAAPPDAQPDRPVEPPVDLGVDATPDMAACQPAEEICNGVDDDCDGKVDEDFADLGDPCEVGKGECKAKGTYKCAADRQALECDAQEGTPQDEICDEKDNDCDGLIDEVKECQKRFVRASTFAAVCQKVSNDKVTFFGTLAQSTPLHEANVASTSNGRTLRGGFLTQVPLQASP